MTGIEEDEEGAAAAVAASVEAALGKAIVSRSIARRRKRETRARFLLFETL